MKYNFELIDRCKISGRGTAMTFDVDDETVKRIFNGNNYGSVDVYVNINNMDLHVIHVSKWRVGVTGIPSDRTGKYVFLVKD